MNDLLSRLIAADIEYKAAMQAAQSQGSVLVKDARSRLGLTQRALAELLHLDFTYISKIENGHQPASKKVLRGIARLLDEQAKSPKDATDDRRQV